MPFQENQVKSKSNTLEAKSCRKLVARLADNEKYGSENCRRKDCLRTTFRVIASDEAVASYGQLHLVMVRFYLF